MRIRVSLVHPFPVFKAWVPVDGADSIQTVEHLKNDLCSRLAVLRDLRVKSRELILLVDEFELLDDSPISIVRDGDLVCVKKKVPETGPSVAQGVSSGLNDLKRKRRSPTPSESSSETSSSSSESSDTSSESSTSDSSSSESSSSDSDSDSGDSSILPAPNPVHSLRKHSPIVTPQKAQQAASFVPPGYGKQSTRSRNLRRRRKRQYDKEDPGQPAPPAKTSAANAVALGDKSTTTSSPEPLVDEGENIEPHLMMMSFRNKNKRKGFKQSMTKVLPAKIIFSELAKEVGEMPVPSSQSAGLSVVAETSTQPPPRLIPPSERKHLPPNLFVTSVDVEEGMKHSKKKRKTHQQEDGPERPYGAGYADDTVLDYGHAQEPELAQTYDAHKASEEEFQITAIEKKWNSYAKVTDKSQLRSGSVVGWKGLAINPSTFTPEMLTTVARVIACDDGNVTTRALRRPVQISFSGVVEEDADPEDEECSWGDVIASEWRVIEL
ncbi:hypothetical protein BV22DRAFT_1028542 [Leucogyrophana mollusca]|uniref:Uncharacterized protein n=1 Tax=Leucogyrophana mollusca TaxID=85980 RepID=A0ACB8BZ08_9AGAM|nr:hypothetical protein BV22DRAFT_1028542 [Leucogyrophana mollusca]